MKNVSIAFCLLVLIACTNTRVKQENAINEMEKTVYSDSTGRLDPAVAAKLVDDYMAFVDAYRNDSVSARYLFKAAELASGLGKNERALELFARYCGEYPETEKAPVALFLQGFIYDDQLKEFGQADKFYTEFLEKYPQHSLANDVAVLKRNLGKSDEELIREFEEQMKIQ